MSRESKTILDPQHEYIRVDPVPTEEELEKFYAAEYYKSAKAGGRSPELDRLLEGGEAARAEVSWLSNTLWRDIEDTLEEQLPPKGTGRRRLLDYGCGTGHFAGHMAKAGYEVEGVEIARAAADVARSSGIKVYDSLEALLADGDGPRTYDAVTSLNVLEHLVDPVKCLAQLRQLVKPGGILVIRVPNDFSEIQRCAQQQIKCDPWWVTLPDHINYFNFVSLEGLMRRIGLEVVDRQGDFPMEMFLLFGDIYLGDPSLGAACHRKRVKYELSLPAYFRRQIGRSLANCGVGRNCLMFGKNAA